MIKTYREYFKRLSEGAKTEELAKMVGKDRKVVRSAIERAGWENLNKGTRKKAEWVYKGERPEEEMLDSEFIFGHNSPSPSKSKTGRVTKSKEAPKNEIDSKTDLDYLLKVDGNKKQNISRNFYLSVESIKVLEQVPQGNKSELVDELIKRFGKEKGLL